MPDAIPKQPLTPEQWEKHIKQLAAKPAPPELVGCIAKIDRADYHIKNLDVETDRFFAEHPNKVIKLYDKDSRELVFKFAKINQPSHLLSIIIGEAAHQLRSAFDHLVWQLVLKKSGGAIPAGVNTRQIQFPIFDTEPAYKSRSGSTINNISASASARIKGLQPFTLGNDFRKSPLWALAELDNTDKHKLLWIAMNHMTGKFHIEFAEGITVKGPDLRCVFTNIPPKEGAEFLRIKAVERNVKVKDLKLPVMLVFPKFAGLKNISVPATLRQLAEWTRRTIGDFYMEF